MIDSPLSNHGFPSAGPLFTWVITGHGISSCFVKKKKPQFLLDDANVCNGGIFFTLLKKRNVQFQLTSSLWHLCGKVQDKINLFRGMFQSALPSNISISNSLLRVTLGRCNSPIIAVIKYIDLLPDFFLQ